MAATLGIDDTCALALAAARVNIFARPEGAEDEPSSSGARAAGVFDAAAACADVAAPVAGSWSRRRRRRGTRVRSRSWALLLALIAVAAVTAQPRGEQAADRATPRLQRPNKPQA